MTDSIIAANSGGGAPRQVRVGSSSSSRPISVSGPNDAARPRRRRQSATDARALRKEHVIVDQDSVRRPHRTRSDGEITKSLNADLFVSIRFAADPHDSAMLMLQAYDLRAANPYRARTAGGKRWRRTKCCTISTCCSCPR